MRLTPTISSFYPRSSATQYIDLSCGDLIPRASIYRGGHFMPVKAFHPFRRVVQGPNVYQYVPSLYDIVEELDCHQVSSYFTPSVPLVESPVGDILLHSRLYYLILHLRREPYPMIAGASELRSSHPSLLIKIVSGVGTDCARHRSLHQAPGESSPRISFSFR